MKETPALKVVYRQVADLIPYARNARTHSDEQVTRIASSIKEFGFTNPILIDGDNGIIAGHGRLAAAKKLGLREVPTIELSGMTDAQKRAYILADNKLALDAGWDEELLRLEFEELRGGAIDLELTGFSLDEINEILGDDPANDDGELSEEKISEALTIDPVSTKGTVWVLGKHKVMCGDSTNEQTVSNFCGHADLLLTDPPYGINVVSSKSGGIGGDEATTFNKENKVGFVGVGGKTSVRKYLSVKADDSIETAKNACSIARKLTDNQIIFGGNYFTEFLPASRCWIVWDKENGDSYFADCELAWTSFNTSVRKFEWLWNGMSRKGERSEELTERIHPTQKPVGLLAEIIRDYSKENQIILDLFGGSGSTLIACEKTNRICKIIEYEPAYVDLIVKRWQDYTGQKAHRESDGVAFDDLAN